MIFCINDFEGPLDLLLHLVRTAKMDIYEIDTKYIIDEYLKYINSLDKLDIDNASEYLVMASELIHLKSKLLLNINDEEEKDEYTINSEEDLKNKLIEYEKYKNITQLFRDLEEKRSEFYTKIPENIDDYQDNISYENNEDINLLKEAMLNLQKRMLYQKPLNTRITKKEITVEERTKYIRDILKYRKELTFNDLFESYAKDLVVATFLSILAMCKNKEIKLSIHQDNNFEDIFITRLE